MVTRNRVSLGLGVSRIANGTLQVSAELSRCSCRRPAKRGCSKLAFVPLARPNGARTVVKMLNPYRGLISGSGLV